MHLEQAKKVLKKAETDHTAEESGAATFGEAEVEEEAITKETAESDEPKKKKVRRVHSGDSAKDADWEELNEETGAWANRPPPTQAEMDAGTLELPDEDTLRAAEVVATTSEALEKPGDADDEEMII